MNFFDALVQQKTPEQLREWLEPMKRNGVVHRPLDARAKQAKAEARQPAPSLAQPIKPMVAEAKPPVGKQEANRAKWRAEAAADMETRRDRGNRLLLGKLRALMPWWAPEAPEPAAQDSIANPAICRTFQAAAIVHHGSPDRFRLMPIQVIDFFNAAPPHNQER